MCPSRKKRVDWVTVVLAIAMATMLCVLLVTTFCVFIAGTLPQQIIAIIACIFVGGAGTITLVDILKEI